MAWIPQDEHLIISSATAAKAPAVMVAAAGSSGGCQLDEREDVATKGVVAGTMSSNGQVPAPKHPLLLAAACNGDWEGLNFLLNREETQASQLFREQLAPYTSGNITNGSCLAMEDEATTSDVEQGSTTPLMSAASLPEGVTVEGYTALHVVAANGDDDNFLKCANLIYGMAANHLSALNNKGDTPLHCATRAGKSQMVSHLIDLASGGRDDTGEDRSVMEFVRKENHQKETALHEAVRIGDNHIVEMLMAVDPELASFPEGYTSPLYLAILLGKYIIAQTLYDKSKGKALSYAGPNGQNALHAAVMRGKALSSQQWFVVCLHVFEANPLALYHPDRDGMFPIHVAASVGAKEVIIMFVTKYPSSAGLRDARGRTFLHLAGGYRADDHTNGGAPTLAGRYTFDAFIIANTLAFICSAIATIGLIFSGISMNTLLTRQIYLAISIVSVSNSVTSLTAAFAIGVYMVLSPVAHKTAIVICVMSPLVLLWGNSQHWLKWAIILRSVCCRMGIINKALLISAVEIFAYVFLEFWPLIFIFSWPAIARNHQHH